MITPVFVDYETWWSTTHSLTKLNPVEYVMHTETELQSISIAIGDGPIEVVFGEDEIRRVMSAIDWSDKMHVSHNAWFDALISSWRLGIKSAAWGCTLSMARPFYALTVGSSLKKLAEILGLPAKGSLDEVNTKGKKLADFTPDEIAKMTVYNKHDTWLCREIFKILKPQLSMHEMRLIDMAIQMSTNPVFEADIPLLQAGLEKEIARKHNILLNLSHVSGTYQSGMTPDEAVEAMRPIIMSQLKFANLLTQLGATVPMKESAVLDVNGYPKMIPALAKTDKGLEALLDDPDERVAMAASTRLEVKSTQLETRIQTFLTVAGSLGGKLPFPVNYCGAAISWRFSGGMKLNLQNLPRVNDDEPKASDVLRQSLVAPEGKIIVVVDSSNIELRVAHALAGSHEVMEKLRAGEDLYCWFASSIFGRVITKKDKEERFIGKVGMLGLQYGASWFTFQNSVRVLSGGKMLLDDEECKRIVNIWRAMFPAITDRRTGIWKKCDRAIEAMFSGLDMEIDSLGLCRTQKERIITPADHWLQYPGLHKNMNLKGKEEWKYGTGYNASRIYDRMLFENLCQHLARIIVMEQTLRLHKVYPVCLTAHDEAGMMVNEGEEGSCMARALAEFSIAPKWWPDLPLSAEAGFGYTYAEAK